MTTPERDTEGSEILARIDAAIKRQLTSRAAACEAAGLNPGYLRDAQRRHTRPKYEAVAALADVLGTTFEILWYGEAAKNGNTPSATPPPLLKASQDAAIGKTPIIGIAYGSIQEASGLSSLPIGWVETPPALRGVPGAYAVYVDGDSMAPLHNPGELRFVDPNRPIRSGDSVIIRSRNNPSEPIKLAIKRFVGRTAKEIIADQLHQPANISFKREAIVSIDRVLTINEIFGV